MTTLTDRQDNTALTVTQSPNLAVIDSESILNKITFGGFWQLKNLLFNQAPMKMPLLLEHACRERELELLLSSNTLKLNQSLERLKLTENERDAAENARIFAEKEALETIKHVQTLIKELQEAKTRVFALEQTMNELEKKMLVSAEISASRIAQLESEECHLSRIRNLLSINS